MRQEASSKIIVRYVPSRHHATAQHHLLDLEDVSSCSNLIELAICGIEVCFVSGNDKKVNQEYPKHLHRASKSSNTSSGLLVALHLVNPVCSSSLLVVKGNPINAKEASPKLTNQIRKEDACSLIQVGIGTCVSGSSAVVHPRRGSTKVQAVLLGRLRGRVLLVELVADLFGKEA